MAINEGFTSFFLLPRKNDLSRKYQPFAIFRASIFADPDGNLLT